MKTTSSILWFILFITLSALTVRAEQPKQPYVKPAPESMSSRMPMTENKDGDLKMNEYEVVSTNGAVTRAYCPYTCQMRGVPKQFCRAWPAKSGNNKCFVWDTRLPNGAVPLGGR